MRLGGNWLLETERFSEVSFQVGEWGLLVIHVLLEVSQSPRIGMGVMYASHDVIKVYDFMQNIRVIYV